jgi:hypothetical protein
LFSEAYYFSPDFSLLTRGSVRDCSGKPGAKRGLVAESPTLKRKTSMVSMVFLLQGHAQIN